LGLGVEQGIKVARNTHFREQTSGIAGGNLGLMHEIRIEVNNMLKRHIDLEVRERIPTNRTDRLKSDEKVKIDIVTIQPEWEAFDQAPDYIDGAYRWCLGLDPGERIELKAEYEINIPSSTEVVGGNNREAE
jgi:hypothetical protein